MTLRILVARLDNVGDVVLTGPAVRAAASGGALVTFLAGPVGAPAAALLPDVGHVITWAAPWVVETAAPVRREAVETLVSAVRDAGIDEALILTSFHQSPLPLALILRLAGVERIAATCVDHPGSLLDERVPYVEARHEVEQNLDVAAALGYHLPAGDDRRLRLRPVPPPPFTLPERYLVVHPQASVATRSVAPGLAEEVVAALIRDERRVVLTGSPADRTVNGPLAQLRPEVEDLTGRTDLPALIAVLAGADAVVVGNTGPAHLAAAVGTPVVSVFAPVVSPHRWAPWGVPHRTLGDLDIDCAGCRCRQCPFEGQPCTASVTVDDVLAAVAAVTDQDRPSVWSTVPGLIGARP